MFGAILGFAFVGALAFGGVTSRFDRDHGEATLVWGSFHFFSVGLAIGAAVLVTYLIESFIFAWPLGGFLAAAIYLLCRGSRVNGCVRMEPSRRKVASKKAGASLSSIP